MFLVRWFLKITGIIPGLLVFLPKRYFLGNVKTTFFYRGPAIVAPNHRGFLDYIQFIAMFPFRRVDVLVSEAMYNYSPVLRFMLKAMGVIKVPALTADMSSTSEAIDRLKAGHIVLIFPEGKIETTPELLEYKQSVALIAMESGAPVIPVFHNGKIGLIKSGKAFVGSEIYASDYISDDRTLSENTAVLTNAIYEKTKEFHDCYYRFFFTNQDGKNGVKESKGNAEVRRKKVNNRNKHVKFPYLFVKYTAMPLMKVLIRPRIICEDEIARMSLYSQKRTVAICNHTWWLDNPMLYYVLKRRSPRSIAAKDIAKKSRAQRIMQQIMGCIFIDRFAFDWNSIKTCLDELNKEGCIALCPEGVFNFDDKLKEFHTGAAMMAVMTESTVMPFYIYTGYKAFHPTYVYVGSPLVFDKSMKKEDIENANIKMQDKMEYLRKWAYDVTPQKEQQIIKEMRKKYKEKVSRF